MDHQALQRIKAFAFPLNAYAYLLVKESAAADVFNLHYGWFDEKTEPISVAQERATQELLSLVPTSPAKILEVGSGVGTTLSILLQRGHEACGITPDGSQIDFMRDRYGDSFPVRQTRFEDLTPSGDQFDVILFQESGQYIPLDKIFTRAAELMRPGGRLIMCDEVLLGDAEVGESLHSFQQLKQMASERGFLIHEEKDHSARAAPTVDLILAASDRYRADLRELLGISEEQIEGLNESNRKYQKKYASGKYGYVSLALTLTK